MKNNSNGNINDFLQAISSSDKQEKENIARRMMSNLSNDDNRRLTDILSDKSKIAQIINSDAAKELIDKLNKRKNG